MRKVYAGGILFFLILIGASQAFADCTITGSPNNSSGNPLAGCSGIVTISGTVTITGNYDVSGQAITSIILTSTGRVHWTTNADFKIPVNCNFVIQTGGQLTAVSPCNSLKTLSRGPNPLASCNGNNVNYSFDQMNQGGGYTGTNAVTASYNSPLCLGTALQLTCNPTGGVLPYLFAWTGPGGYTSNVQNPPAIASPTAGTYTVVVTDVLGITATASTTVVINPLPSAPTGTPNSRCGTGTVTISASTTTGNVIDWYANSTGGTALLSGSNNYTTPSISTTTTYYAQTRTSATGCLSTSRTAVTATVNPIPSATISYSSASYCATGNVQAVTVTGQGGGSFSSTAGLTINTANGEINPATSTAGTYTVTYTFTNGLCSNTATTSVTINALPAAPAAGNNSRCGTGTVTITATPPAGSTIDWYANSTGGSALVTGNTSFTTPSISSNTTYYAESRNTTTGCVSSTRTAVIATVNTVPSATISYSQTSYCAAGSLQSVTITGQTGGSFSSAAGLSLNSSNGDINPATSSAGNYTVTYTFTNGLCSNTTTTSVTILAVPTAPSGTGNSRCGTGTVTISATAPSGSVVDWYANPTGGTPLLSGSNSFTTPSISSSTPYYAESRNTTTGCVSSTRTSVTATVNPIPSATISYAFASYCATGPVQTVTITGQTGGTFSSTAGLSLNASNGEINPATSTAGTYTVTYNFSNGLCSNSTSTSVTIFELPAAPTGAGNSRCGTGTVTISATAPSGSVVDWYANPTGGSPLLSGSNSFTTPSISSSTPYYAESRNTTTGCVSSTRTTVTATVIPGPSATISYSSPSFCATGTLQSVIITGQTGGTFSSTPGLSLNTGNGDINPATSSPGTYTVTYDFTNGSCNNSTTTIVTIYELPAAPSGSGNSRCGTGTVTISASAPSGSVVDWYANPTGGSPLLSGSNSFTTPSISSSTPYYAQSRNTTTGCVSSTRTSVTATVNPVPSATISYALAAYCATGPAQTVTITGQTGGTFSSTAGLTLNNSNGDIDPATSSAGTYTVTYNFSNGLCSNSTSTSVTIFELPAAPSGSGNSRCGTGTVTISATAPSGSVVDWYANPTGGSPLLSGSNSFTTPSISSSTPYYAQSRNTTTGCASSTRTSVTATVNPVPSATISYAFSSYCATGPVQTVTITGQTGGTFSSTAGLTLNTSNGNIDPATSSAGTYTVTYNFSNGLCSNSTSTSVTIFELPAAPTGSGNSRCGTGTVTISATATSGSVVDWYANPTGGSPLLSGSNNFTTPSISSSTPYYAESRNTTTGCVSSTRTSVTATVNPVPSATISYAFSSYCATGPVQTVTITGQTGGTFSSTAGLTLNASNGEINPATSSAGTYTVTYNFSNGLCSNSTSTSVTIFELPAAPTGSDNSRCGIGTVTISATAPSGSVVDWYANPTGGSPLLSGSNSFTTPSISSSTPYYAESRNTTTGCVSSTRTSVTATVNPIPTATVSYAFSSYCATGPVQTVTITGQTGGTFSSTAGLSLNASNGDIDPATSSAGTYTVTYDFTNGSCNNSTTTTVTIYELPAAPSGSGNSRCGTGTVTISATAPSGSVVDWYANPTGGSPLLSGSNSFTTPSISSSTPYYAESRNTTTGCVSSTRASVTATVNPVPSATITYSFPSFCTGSGIQSVTITGQGGGSFSSTAGLSLNTSNGEINTATSTPGFYTVIYSFNNGICSSTTSTDVTIQTAASASISYSSPYFCTSETQPQTVILTGAAGGTFSSTSGLVIDSNTGSITPSASNAGSYVVTYITPATPGCSPTTTTTNIDILNGATVSAGDDGEVCYQTAFTVNGNVSPSGTVNWLTTGNGTFGNASALSTTYTPGTADTTSGSVWLILETVSGCYSRDSLKLSINKIPAIPVINSPRVICAGNSDAISVVPVANADTYHWWIQTPGTLASLTGQTNTAIIPTNLGTGISGLYISARASNECGISDSSRFWIRSYISAPTLGGPTSVCAGSTYSYTSRVIAGADSVKWVLPANVTAVQVDSITYNITYGAGFTGGSITINAYFVCQNTSITRNIILVPVRTPAAISGLSTSLCDTTVTFSVPAVQDASGYQWIVPAGVTVVGPSNTNSITLTFGAFTTGTLSVKSFNPCGVEGGLRSLSIKGAPATPASISGPVTVCALQTGLNYSTPAIVGAHSYTWTVPNSASILSGQGTNAIVVKWGPASGSLSVKASRSCGGVGSAKSLAVTVNCRQGEELADNVFMVSPNPNSNNFTVTIKGLESGHEINYTIRDLSGRLLSTKKSISDSIITEKFETALPQGIYLLQVESGEYFRVQKFIIE